MSRVGRVKVYVVYTVIYKLIVLVTTNSYRLPECHYNRYENITKPATRTVYARIMSRYDSVRLIYAFVLTYSSRCVGQITCYLSYYVDQLGSYVLFILMNIKRYVAILLLYGEYLVI